MGTRRPQGVSTRSADVDGRAYRPDMQERVLRFEDLLPQAIGRWKMAAAAIDAVTTTPDPVQQRDKLRGAAMLAGCANGDVATARITDPVAWAADGRQLGEIRARLRAVEEAVSILAWSLELEDRVPGADIASVVGEILRYTATTRALLSDVGGDATA